MVRISVAVALAALAFFAASPVFAQSIGIAGQPDSGDTAWVLTSSALVLMMSLPGLALFYGGLVRARNFLSVLVQIGAIAAAVSVLWIALGYSLAFPPTAVSGSARCPT